MKKRHVFILILFFAIVKPICAQNWQVEPHEYLVISFEDSTSAKDTVIVGFYYDPNFETDNAIVSIGIDSVFGEENMPEEVIDTNFIARSEIHFEDEIPAKYGNLEYEVFSKIDIRYNTNYCGYSSGKNIPEFKIKFYNAVTPIIAKTDVFYAENGGYLSCFSSESSNYMDIIVPDCLYKEEINCITYSCIDTIGCNQIDYYGISIYELIKDNLNSVNSDYDIKVFPNPSNGMVNIKLDHNPNEGLYLNVYNSEGALILKESINMTSFQFKISEPGVYFLEMTDGIKKYSKKIIVTG
jgi:hypothetical protein